MRTKQSREYILAATLLFFSGSFHPQISWAQSESPREHVVLPPTLAGTPLSVQIQAEAAYLAARGDLAESVAIARKIHAEAFAQEINNSIDYVDAFFRRRELNRQWRAKENPNYIEREKQRQEVLKYRFEHQFQDVLKGDVTDMLNWALVELSGPALALQYVAGHVSFADSESFRQIQNGRSMATEIPLADSESGYIISSADMALIRFSDGRLTFSATDPQILQTSWPFALRASEFDTLREGFRATREKVLQELASEGQVGFENGEQLIKSVNDMLVALDDAYPPKKRREASHTNHYYAAKRYLRTLAAETHQAIRYSDRSIYSRTISFEGGTVMELIQHMDRTGLMFASPAPGGDRVYRSLLSDMRSLYFTLNDSSVTNESDIPASKSSDK